MTELTDVQGLREQLRADLKTAMKARDAATVSALRTTLAALDNAEAVVVSDASTRVSGAIAGAQSGVGSTEVSRRVLSLAEMRAILETQVAERVSAAADYQRLGRDDESERLRQEADVVRRYLDLLTADSA